MANHDVKTGTFCTIQRKVETNCTAGALYNEGVLEILFSTPALVSMMIDASIELLSSSLPKDCVSVATACNIMHENPTIFGETVTVKVTVTRVEGNKIYFDMVASDDAGIIGRGTHERVIVEKEKLLERAYRRLNKK